MGGFCVSGFLYLPNGDGSEGTRIWPMAQFIAKVKVLAKDTTNKQKV
jgi:hypothetical protein